MHDIFLSYDHDDRDRIAALVDALTPFGWKIWWDRNILPGQTWDQVLAEALESARCVLVAWTRHSIESDWVRIEANRGRERGVLVPALLDAVQIPLAFQLVQAAPMIDWDGRASHAGFAALVSGIRALVERTPVIAAPIAVAEERALDAAVPSQLRVRQPAHLITMIRRAESAGLKAILEAEPSEAAPEDVTSRAFELAFPRDAAGRPQPVNLSLRVNAPEFDPPSQEKKVRVSPSRDSGVFDFLLTPRETGDLVVQLEVYEQDVCLASRVLHATGVDDLRGHAHAHAVVSMALPVKVQPMAAAAAAGVTGEFRPPIPAPVYQPSPLPPQRPQPVKRGTSMAWMKFAVAAAVAFLCVPVVWFGMRGKPEEGSKSQSSTAPPPAEAKSEISVLFRSRRAGAVIEVRGETCRTPCVRQLEPGPVEISVRRGTTAFTVTVTIPRTRQITLLVDEQARHIRIQEEKK